MHAAMVAADRSAYSGSPRSGVGFELDLVNPVLMNRRAAFDVFDVEHNGTINAFELLNALMSCDDVRGAVNSQNKRTLHDAEVQAAIDRVGILPGGVITFQEFAAVCDILVHSLESKRIAEEQRAAQRQRDEEEEVLMAQYGAPPSPRGPKALLWDPDEHPELGPIQRSFYSFDVDHSGTVYGLEVPRMLRLAGIGPKSSDPEVWRKYDRKWKDALASIYPPKEPTDLLNVHDFHDLCMVLEPEVVRELEPRPPPPPPPPPDPDKLTPEELARLERERAEEERRRLEEEERARRAEEVRQRKATLFVLLPNGGACALPETQPGDRVSDLQRRIEEAEGIPASQQRLVCQGWEMSPVETLDTYKVRTGDPRLDKGHVVTLLLRQPTVSEENRRGQLGPLTVRSQTGEVWQVTAKEDDAVSEVMNRVAELSGAPATQLRLVGNGRELVPYERLRDAGLAPGDTLVLLFRH
eukprot:TRINITY_DN4829_c0_g1_i1.p1 TRINITY_DN4829_c0_g1~~TRINITY_DN4829_c0_g1_i1.p1  ORF type:complete len:498 (+),score=204.23 TRINITY_DN4829_c0_g1_i1:92-1495(+)